MLREVISAFDGSPQARAAGALAGAIAQRAGARLVLVHVVDGPADTPEWIAEAAPPGLDAQVVMPAGDPARAIADLVDRRRPDLLMAGTRGMGPARRLLGSVSQRLLETVGCPVGLVAGADAAAPQAIVVGLDGSEPAQRAVALGARLSAALSVPLHLVHVAAWPLARGAPRRRPGLAARLREEGEALVRAARARIAAPVEQVVEVVREGDPPSELLAVARDEGPCVLVVGDQGFSGPLDAVLGGTARRLAGDPTCPVIVTRHGPEGPRLPPPASV